MDKAQKWIKSNPHDPKENIAPEFREKPFRCGECNKMKPRSESWKPASGDGCFICSECYATYK